MAVSDPLEGVHWRPRTRQEDGRRTERQVAKERGARVHPMSGAGRIKGDASTDDEQFEVKDAGKSFRLKETDVLKHDTESIAQRKRGVWVIRFEGGTEVEVRVTKRGQA